MEPVRFIDKIKVSASPRRVKCFCGKNTGKTIVPHLKQDHPTIWREWMDLAARDYASGYQLKTIMQGRFKRLFTWTVIDSEIKKIAETRSTAFGSFKKADIKRWSPTKEEFSMPGTTVWNFPRRGSWAVHTNLYRGNWAPQVPRALILKYSRPGDLIVDPFVGSGTTLIEAWLNNRKSIGVDISPLAIKISNDLIRAMGSHRDKDLALNRKLKPKLLRGDTRNIETLLLQKAKIKNGEVKLICAHPPYLDAVKYTASTVGDLSRMGHVDRFMQEFGSVASQFFRLLKRGGHLAILMGDVKRNGMNIPLGLEMTHVFQEAGFSLKHIIVKTQHQDRSTEFYFKNSRPEFLMAHEYLLILQKS